MKIGRLSVCILGLLAMVAGAPAYAHTGGAFSPGFFPGLWHPLSGADHLLAMVLVGLWAVQYGGRAVLLLPFSFALMMMVGGGAGLSGAVLPIIEPSIMLSLVVLGGMVALARRIPLAASLTLVGAFAFFHGQAHGAEMPYAASALVYASGFTVATGLLHMTGIALGYAMKDRAAWTRAGAAAAAGYGVILLMTI